MSAVARLVDDCEPVRCGRPDGGESVITAALLVATAFRLRDEDALVIALRQLVEAVRRFETTHQ